MGAGGGAATMHPVGKCFSTEKTYGLAGVSSS